MALKDDKFHDVNYILTLIINTIAILILAASACYFKSFGKKTNILYLGTLLLSFLIFCMAALSVTLNQRSVNQAIMATYQQIALIVIVFHVLIKATICILLSIRTYLVIIETRKKRAILAINIILSICLLVNLRFVIRAHEDVFIHVLNKDLVMLKTAIIVLSAWNLCQILFFSLLIFGNTIFIIRYIGRLYHYPLCFYSIRAETGADQGLQQLF